MLDLRPETPQDHDAVRVLHMRAFDPSPAEARLVDLLRESGASVPELCLVATERDVVVGQVFFSRATVGSGRAVLALAPMAVIPERQNGGIGSALVREGLRRAALTEYPLVVVLGHPEYYPRFGFEPAEPAGVVCPFDGVPSEAWMLHRLPSHEPEARGTVTYAPAFAAVT